MSQEENSENIVGNEGAKGAAEGNSETETAAAGLAGQESGAGEVDKVPVESIGSYARVEPLLTDEEAGETTNRDSES